MEREITVFHCYSFGKHSWLSKLSIGSLNSQKYLDSLDFLDIYSRVLDSLDFLDIYSRVLDSLDFLAVYSRVLDSLDFLDINSRV